MMAEGRDVRLRAREVDALVAAQRVLLAPLAHATAAAWCLAANRVVKALVGADRAGFCLPGAAHDSPAAPVDGYPPDAGADRPDRPARPVVPATEDFTYDEAVVYPRRVAPVDTTVPMFPRLHALGACTRDETLGPNQEAFYRSSYYRDYLVPVRAFDCAMLGVARLGAPGEGATFATTANLLCFHDTPRGRRFGAREVVLLRLVYPAFRAGVEAWWALGRHTAALARMVDALGLALAVVDRAGREVHRTPALTALYAAEPDAVVLDTIVRRAGRGSFGRALGERLDGPPPAGALPLVRTRAHVYRVRAVLLAGVDGFAATPGADDAPAAVLVERLAPAGPGDTRTILPPERASRSAAASAMRARDVAARLGLTAAQAQVALLVADGLTNAAVAGRLSLSPHTVRHHLEHACQRLGVVGRGTLAARVHSAGRHLSEP